MLPMCVWVDIHICAGVCVYIDVYEYVYVCACVHVLAEVIGQRSEMSTGDIIP